MALFIMTSSEIRRRGKVRLVLIAYRCKREDGIRTGERDGIKGCNRLRTLTVDKGLLREVTLLQKEMDTLVECKVRGLPSGGNGI